jgi:hypothetical protein
MQTMNKANFAPVKKGKILLQEAKKDDKMI